MGLVQVSTNTVTSAVSNVILTGIDSDDTYMIYINGWTCSTDNQAPLGRVTSSGSARTASNYSGAQKNMISSTSYTNGYYSNSLGTGQYFYFAEEIGTGTGEQCNMILRLFNFNNSSEYSFITNVGAEWTASPRLVSRRGGGMHSLAETNDGMEFSMASGNITGGTFTIYRVI